MRRSSTTPFNNSQAFANSPAAIDTSLATSAAPIDAPATSTDYHAIDPATAKYTREELLEIGRLAASGPHDVDIDALMMPGFSRGGHVNGNSSRGWGKANDANVHNDPTICWNDDGSCSPLGLRGLSAEEKEVCALHVLKIVPSTRCVTSFSPSAPCPARAICTPECANQIIIALFSSFPLM